LLLAGSLAPSDPLRAQGDEPGDRCVSCHVSQFNRGIEAPIQHPPFWERRCTTCHLKPGSDWPSQAQAVTSDISGSLVTQEPLWRKQQRYAGAQSTTEHSAALADLDSSAVYRFRLQVGNDRSTAELSSHWLGLHSGQLWNSANRELTTSNGLSGAISSRIESLTLTAIAENRVLVFWRTAIPSYSWLELQQLQEDSAPENQLTPEANQHPPLREPDRLAINACYQCHPESELGTSHPVRLYGGQDVRIPAELPTVDGMMTCVTCHDPHGGQGKMLVRTLIKTQLCVTCHYKYKNSSPSTMFRD
jgi:predicted CXXCH cytochrome family protein